MSVSTISARSSLADPQGLMDYWRETQRPLANLVFLAPLVVVYEFGVLVLGGGHADALRNGADYWLRGSLAWLGAAGLWLPPLLLAGLLTIWQIAGRHAWRISAQVLVGMAAESLLFACLLVIAGQSLHQFLGIVSISNEAVRLSLHSILSLGDASGLAARTLGFVGAGIYEEFVFRLCLGPALYFAARGLLLPHRPAVLAAILVTSVTFSLAHEFQLRADESLVNLVTEAFSRSQATAASSAAFSFRILAGMIFAVLFYTRGLGITVGCHAVYDLVVGVLLTPEL